MYIIKLTNIGPDHVSRIINADVATKVEAEARACREAGKIVGIATGYLCYIGAGMYLIRVGKFIEGTVKIKYVKGTEQTGGQVT